MENGKQDDNEDGNTPDAVREHLVCPVASGEFFPFCVLLFIGSRIVCRNVLIYFTEDAKLEIYKKFNDSLVKGGCLFVGNTEQIINYKDLGYESSELFFYRKK